MEPLPSEMEEPPQRFINFHIRGVPFAIPDGAIRKYPFSTLADYASTALNGGWAKIDMDPAIFAVISHFLTYGSMAVPENVPISSVRSAMEELGIPWPGSEPENEFQLRRSPTSPTSEEAVPSYEESVRGSLRTLDYRPDVKRSAPVTGTLSERLALTRESRIRTLLDNQILPLIDEQGLSGLYSTVFVLIPSNIKSLQVSKSGYDFGDTEDELAAKDSREELVGFDCNENVKLVRLTGESNTMEFWRQPAVAQELQLQLRALLNADGLNISNDPQSQSIQGSSTAPQMGSSTFRWRNPSSLIRDNQEEERLRKGLWNVGWRAAAFKQPLAPGAVRIDLAVQDISIRMESEWGLLETRSGPGLVLRIEVGA